MQSGYLRRSRILAAAASIHVRLHKGTKVQTRRLSGLTCDKTCSYIQTRQQRSSVRVERSEFDPSPSKHHTMFRDTTFRFTPGIQCHDMFTTLYWPHMQQELMLSNMQLQMCWGGPRPMTSQNCLPQNINTTLLSSKYPRNIMGVSEMHDPRQSWPRLEHPAVMSCYALVNIAPSCCKYCIPSPCLRDPN